MTGEDRKAYSPERLDEAVAQVTELAEKVGAKIALCGGLAMQSYGSERLTKDVDVVTDLRIEALPFVRDLSFGGVQVTAPNGVPVDLILRNDEYRALYEAALTSAGSRPGIPCRVVDPSYLAAMKLAARRHRDLGDLHWLITSGLLDLDSARKIIHKFVGGRFAADEFDREIEFARLEAEREDRVRGG